MLSYPDFVQVPHHGSRRNVTPYVLDRWLGGRRKTEGATIGCAFCSVGDNQPKYPRAQVKNAFIRRGYPVHVTRRDTKTHFAATRGVVGQLPNQSHSNIGWRPDHAGVVEVL